MSVACPVHEGVGVAESFHRSAAKYFGVRRIMMLSRMPLWPVQLAARIPKRADERRSSEASKEKNNVSQRDGLAGHKLCYGDHAEAAESVGTACRVQVQGERDTCEDDCKEDEARTVGDTWYWSR